MDCFGIKRSLAKLAQYASTADNCTLVRRDLTNINRLMKRARASSCTIPSNLRAHVGRAESAALSSCPSALSGPKRRKNRRRR